MTLSTRQREFLAAAFRCTKFPDTWGQPCVFPRGAGQWSTARSLVRLGYLEFAGWGRDIDCEMDGDVHLFAATVEGTRVSFGLGDIDEGYLAPCVAFGLRALCSGLNPFGRQPTAARRSLP